MRQKPVARRVAACLALFSAVSLAPVQAELRLSTKMHRQVVSINEQLYGETPDPLAALAQSEAFLALARAPEARALGLRLRASALLSLERYAQAMPDLQAALDLGVLPADIAQELRYTLARLAYGESQWQRALDTLAAWIERGGQPTADDDLLQAQCAFELQRWKAVLPPLQQAIARRGREAPESWYQLQLATLLELGRHRAVVELLAQMLERFRQRQSYWLQLAASHQQLENYAGALAALRTAHAAGLLSEHSHQRWLAQLLIREGAPQRAAELLQRARDSGQWSGSERDLRLLVQAWLLAHEPARALPLQRELAERQGEADGYERWARLALQVKDWPGANRAAAKGLALAPDNAGELWLLDGLAHLHQDKRARARDSFVQAQARPESRDQAASWLRWLDEDEALEQSAAAE